MTTDPRWTKAWKALSKRVAREEPMCWLRLPGCTLVSTLGDHVISVKDRPDLALVRSNVRGACASCNGKKGSLPPQALRLPDAPQPPALGVFD